MTISVTNPETLRDEIATFLTSDLVGTGKPAQAVYNYEKADFGGQSPVVLVTSNSEDFSRHSNTERTKGLYYVDVLIFALYADEQSNYYEADCEDQLNLVLKTTIDSILNNQFTSSRSIFIDSKTTISPANVGGGDYRMERLPLRVEVFNG